METSKKHLSDKAVNLIWRYYQSFSVVNMTTNMERVVTHMAIRRALEDCINDKDKETYVNILSGTEGWKKLDDSYKKIKVKN